MTEEACVVAVPSVTETSDEPPTKQTKMDDGAASVVGDGCDGEEGDEYEEVGEGGEEGEGGGQPAAPSKKALKRMARTERYQAFRVEKRKQERERRKETRARIKAEGGELKKRCKPTLMEDSKCRTRVAVDMQFDHLMVEKDLRRCISQIGFTYAANRRAQNPMQLWLTAFNGAGRKIHDDNSTNLNRDLHITEKPLEETFHKDDIVYLTSDSSNVLTKLDDSKVYVIGGLVDHNSQKGLCYHIACEKGWGHARLPIDEFVNMQSRKVLTVNQVFEIVLGFSETGDWEKSFFNVLPKRKGAEKKEQGGEEGQAGEEKEQEQEKREAEEREEGEKEPAGDEKVEVAEECA